MNPIYLDYQATTPLAPEAGAAMRPWIEERFANPHSPHRLGREAAAAIEHARDQVTSALGKGAGEGRLFFTSGATEAINWAIKGSFERLSAGRPRIVTFATEHAAVLDSAAWLQGQGAELVILPVDGDGLIGPEAAAAIDEKTALVALLYVNNEIGVVQSKALDLLSRRARDVGALLLCDAVQAFGRVPVPVEACDLLALSAHKIHGPKGVGALWVREGATPAPLLHGGGQEGGVRSGTLPTALCVGFGAAAALAQDRMDEGARHVSFLYERLIARLGEEWQVNGSEVSRWRGNVSVRRHGLDAARLISELRGIAFSAGSACASGSGRSSHVLRAIGLSEKEARSSIRLGFGRYTSLEEVEKASDLILEAAARQKVAA